MNTETKNNKCFFRQGCHNSGKPITVVPGLKKYVKNRKAKRDYRLKTTTKTDRQIT